MDRLIHTALQGKPVAWFGPTYKSVADTWRELCSLLADITCSRNEQEKRLELLGGGVIDVWSLDSPDAGRGRKYALVVIDEAAMIPNLSQVWQESIRPTLTDLHGSAWILSTPRGMNDFKTLFDVGQDCERQDWISWQMPTAANPFMDPAEIDAARQDLTEAAFNQEYLAQFIDSEGSVFRRVFDLATADPKVKPETGHEYIIGCDWGRSQDYTVFIVVDATAHKVVALDRSNHVDYALQRNRLRALCETWQPKRIIAEQNSIGQPIIEQLRREGLRIEPFTTTNASKTIAIEGLALAFERGDIQILNHPVLVNELIAYRAERLPTGSTRYSAPPGQHDDCVMALAIAWSAVTEQHHPVYPVAEADLIVDPFDIPETWPRGYGLDLTPHGVAAIWGAMDPQSKELYLYDEYRSEEGDPLSKLLEIRRRGEWIPGVLEQLGNGRNQDDGIRLLKICREKLGDQLHFARSLLESGILEMSHRMTLGQLKVFSTLTQFREELRGYRRNSQGQIIVGNDQLQNAARCLVISGMQHMRTQLVKRAPVYEPRLPTGERSWMGYGG